MKELDKEIQQTFAEVKKQEKYIHKLELISQQILQQEVLLSELSAQKNEELKDVEELETDSLRNIFLFFLGKKEDLLEIERQEYLWAHLNYLACKRRIKALKVDKSVIEAEISKFHVVNNYLDDLLLRKKRRINKSVKEFAKYKSLNDRVLTREHKVKEIHEALFAGTDLLKLVAELKIELIKVKEQDWNSLDQKTSQKYHGKGNSSSFEKKKYGKFTQALLHEIDQHLIKFKSELQDIHTNFQLNFTRHLIVFENFLSIFYDNLITDWVVQNEIQNAQHSTDILYNKIERILLMLEHEHKTTHHELDYYRLKRREYLLEK